MSRLGSKAMINADGEVFQPATVEIARHIAAMHDARPAGPEFPWRCPEHERLWTSPGEFGQAREVQCVLVDLHDGDHVGEVTW